MEKEVLYAILPYFPGKWTIVWKSCYPEGSYTEGRGEMKELEKALGQQNVPIIDYRNNERAWESVEIFDRKVKPREEKPEYSGTLDEYLTALHARGITIHNWNKGRVKMPKCPECKAEILELNEIVCQYRENRVWASKSQTFLESEEIDVRDEELVHYECPECEGIIFFTYTDALSFLLTQGE